MGSFNGMPARRAPSMPPAAPDRTKLIRAIQAAARRHGLDDDARREMQFGAVGKASLTAMDAGELGRVLQRLNQGRPAPADRPHIGKVRALWWTLYWLGAVDQAEAGAIDAFVRRQTGIAALRFLDHRQAHSVIDALKGWAAREGVEWPVKPDRLRDRLAVIVAIARKLADRGHQAVLPVEDAAAPDLDAAIRKLGKQLRRELGKA